MVPTGRRFLSRTAEHALRATILLARHRGTGFVPAGEVADALGTPPNYTSKTLRQLSRKGLLRSVRGPRGGFALDVDPAELSLARVVEAVDEAPERAAVCLLGDRPCDEARPCTAHARWTEVQHRANALLEETMLADFLEDEGAA